MKKVLSVFLVLMIVLGMTACSKKAEEEPEAEATTPATMTVAAFKAAAKDNESASAEDLANTVVVAEFIPFMGAVMPVEEGYLNGFTEEITGFKEGCFFGPMIGSIPFAGYVFELEEGADVNAFMDLLKEKADLRWNICTQADEMACGNVGNKVCFVMAPANFDEE